MTGQAFRWLAVEYPPARAAALPCVWLMSTAFARVAVEDVQSALVALRQARPACRAVVLSPEEGAQLDRRLGLEPEALVQVHDVESLLRSTGPPAGGEAWS